MTPDLETDFDLPDLVNLRDLGGLATRHGGRVRPGVVYRSASPYFLDAAQAARLVHGLGVRLRVDLRSESEVAEATNSHLAAVERQVLHLPIRSGADGWPVRGDASAADRIAAYYLGYLEHSRDSVLAMVQALAAPEGTPALLHCTAGKDRTGVVVAVLLSALGVPDDEVVADYARTHDHVQPLFTQLARLPAYDERIAVLPQEARTAEPATMAAFLDALRERYGGATAFLTAHGLPDQVLAQLRAALVEPAGVET